ncbi:leucine-rich repeat domain-containing protein [Treponema sp. OMZ 799]|uniref:InlB B-repeat-containing protein n=1 Tax=Treponema sp. OMZ 799 TaxID=2563668 RepID=UPI0020A45F96|nr:leucine-rich repeat domain-containing protein [Treponema sp. OMZ 799]UTC78996.1 leucine-rich repeat domain-containing protein [Treponema sp. OMZ 799]
MKTNNSKTKTKAFLGAAFMLLIALIFTACPQRAKPKPKHAITFSVDGANGKLTAKVDGGDIASGKEVEEGKAVIFTATANDGYRVKGWTLDGSAVNGTNTEYKLKVSKPATVKVSFEAIPPTKYTVTLTQTEHGKVTASPEIPEDKQVAEDTEITFTAKTDDGYKVDKWTVTPAEALQAGTGADGSESAKVKITADTTVSVSFIKKTYAITFSVEGGTGGTLEAKVDGKEISSGDMVEHGKEVEFTPKEEKGYRVKKWTLDGENIGGMAYFTLGVSQAATVTVSFEPNPVEGGAVLILSPDKLTIKVRAVTEDGSAITVEGCNETTLENGKYTELHAKGTKVILKGNITGLSCDGNNLTSLNVQGLTALQKLSCSANKLTELNVQGLTALQELWCSGNQLPELNVQGLTALQKLECRENQLTELNVQGLTALQKLECWKNQLTELNVQGCAALQKLGCYSNQLNAKAMTELLNALPARTAGDDAKAWLYTEETDKPEGNCKDFSQPAELKAALDDAKSRNWKLKKINESGILKDI